EQNDRRAALLRLVSTIATEGTMPHSLRDVVHWLAQLRHGVEREEWWEAIVAAWGRRPLRIRVDDFVRTGGPPAARGGYVSVVISGFIEAGTVRTGDLLRIPLTGGQYTDHPADRLEVYGNTLDQVRAGCDPLFFALVFRSPVLAEQSVAQGGVITLS